MTRRCQLCGATGVLQSIGPMTVCVRQSCQSVARDAARDALRARYHGWTTTAPRTRSRTRYDGSRSPMVNRLDADGDTRDTFVTVPQRAERARKEAG